MYSARVFPDVLKICYQSLTSQEKDSVNTLISDLSCARELISFSRRVWSLEEVSQFKANEMFNWLFFLSPIVFFRRISDSLYSHLSNLVFGIRLIFESCSPERVIEAEKFLQQICQEIVSIHGDNERKETINVQNLRHLPDQVSRFGPLFYQSALSFQAANRSLGEVFSGSNSECEIIYRRLLQRHNLQPVEINDARLCPIYSKLSGNPNKMALMLLWKLRRFWRFDNFILMEFSQTNNGIEIFTLILRHTRSRSKEIVPFIFLWKRRIFWKNPVPC